MKRRLLFISLALALVLTTLMPAVALAAKPASFAASGTILGITPPELTDQKPAGESGRWVVATRQLWVSFNQGDLSGLATMTYKGNFEAYTQAGNFAGKLESAEYVFKVNGKTDPLEYSGWVPNSENGWLPTKAKLNLGGHWNLKEGALGQGSFTGVVAFELENGHVKGIILEESFFDLTGKWQP